MGLHALYTSDYIPSVSAALRTVTGTKWMCDMIMPASIFSGALSIMRPQLYDVGLRGMELLGQCNGR